MVQIAPLLSTITVLSSFNPTDSTLNGLAVRQSFDSGSLPSACQSPCQVVDTMTNCGTSLSCMCTNNVGSQLEQCVSCLVSTELSLESFAESTISNWNEICSSDLSLSGGSTSGGTTGGTTSGMTGGATGGTTGGTTTTTSFSGGSTNPPGAIASGTIGLKTCSITVFIVAALAGAFMSL